MKNLYIIILCSSILFSCSNDDGNAQQPDSVNESPTVPSLTYPTNNLVCTNFRLGFDWDIATDTEGDVVSYQIDIATENIFSTLLFSVVTSQTNRAFTLEKGTTYYWRVKAIDNQGNESAYSATHSFFTEPEAGVNTIPEVPALVSPALSTTLSGSSASIEWNATDNDGDPLVFDIYFGDINPPPLLAENLDTTTFDAMILANTTYYWRVVVKDNQQGVAIGQVWSFKTD